MTEVDDFESNTMMTRTAEERKGRLTGRVKVVDKQAMREAVHLRRRRIWPVIHPDSPRIRPSPPLPVCHAIQRITLLSGKSKSSNLYQLHN